MATGPCDAAYARPAQSVSVRPTSRRQLCGRWTSTLFWDTSGDFSAALDYTTSRHAAASAWGCLLHAASGFASALHAQHELLRKRGRHRKLCP